MTLTDRGETVVKWLMVAAVLTFVFALVFADSRLSKDAYERCLNRGNPESSCDNILEP